jgi:hypothetical protein
METIAGAARRSGSYDKQLPRSAASRFDFSLEPAPEYPARWRDPQIRLNCFSDSMNRFSRFI